MHRAKNMVGEQRANYNVSLPRRYFHLSKHRKPGRIVKSILSVFIALEVTLGVVVYG